MSKNTKIINRDKWVWMPHPGHLICASNCRFVLNTKVGKYIVSTVGEYFPDEGVREINAKSRGVVLKGMGDERRHDYMKKIGFEDIGCDRKYETMVFKAQKAEAQCCPYEVADHSEIDMDGYNDPKSAYEGHMKMCAKWAKK